MALQTSTLQPTHASARPDVCPPPAAEAKRSEFPRFYFVSDPTLLEILSLGSDPPSVVPHFQSGLFDSLSNVTFDKVGGGAAGRGGKQVTAWWLQGGGAGVPWGREAESVACCSRPSAACLCNPENIPLVVNAG